MIKSYFIFLLLTAGIFFETTSNCAPLNEISESPDLEETLEEDDLTTHTFDRLSSAATCLVAGVEYTHGQQIYRNDPCEFCLCLDGEMFCWWQDCPPTFEGPCRDRLPFSPCANGPKSTIESKVSQTSNLSSSKSTDVETTSHKLESSSTESTETEPQSETSTTVNVSETPSLCIVMGKTYQIGASLPHATGNCVECICGSGAQVTCSPHQCAPPGDDISDYRPPGPRPPLPDTF